MFILQETPIDTIKARNSFNDSSLGAFVNFEGIVRADQIKDSQVKSLLYLADSPVCIEEGQKIVAEALASFSVKEILCVQRIGEVQVGETAIWIGVWSSHRDEAFQACRYVIEEIKKRLRIWKKERLNNGSSVWAYGAETPVI